MQLKHLRTLQAGERVQAFLDTEGGNFGAVVSPELRARLDDAVAQLAGFKIEQGRTAASALGETATLGTMREELYNRFMRPIGHLAKAVLPTSPDLEKLVVPAFAVTHARLGDFHTAAENMLEAVEQNEAALRAGGLAVSDLAQFKQAMAKLDVLYRSRLEHLGRRAASAAGLGAANKAVKVVISTLDALLRVPLKTNESLRGRWAVARRIVKTAVTPMRTGSDSATDNGAGGSSAPAATAA